MLIHEPIFNVDVWLFYAVNLGWANPVFDAVMPVVTNTAYWRPIYVVALLLLLWKGGVRGRWAAVTLIIMVAAFDPLSTHLLKETIGRLRPYDALDGPEQHGSGCDPHPLLSQQMVGLVDHHGPDLHQSCVLRCALAK